MSADNIIYIIPFIRDDKRLVHRVCEVRVSGEKYSLEAAMRVGAYTEHIGPDSYQLAKSEARRLRKTLEVLEYGIHDYAADPVNIQHFLDQV
jgi:hypothetical protein